MKRVLDHTHAEILLEVALMKVVSGQKKVHQVHRVQKEEKDLEDPMENGESLDNLGQKEKPGKKVILDRQDQVENSEEMG